MNHPDDRRPREADLRAAAEADVTRRPVGESELRTPAQLLHELQVHQIELEMQHETLRQSQIALEASRDSYMNLYEFAPTGYLTLTAAGLVSRCNLTGAVLLASDRRAVLNRGFSTFVAAHELDHWYRLFHAATTTQNGCSEELMLRRGDGSSFPALIGCRHTSLAGENDDIMLTMTSLEQLKKVEADLVASENRYGALFRDASDPIAIADLQGRIEEVNAGFATLSGYSTDELRGMSVNDLHPAEELPKVARHFADIAQAGRPISLETKLMCKDGLLIDVEIRASQIEIAGSKVAQGVFRVLTERKRAEQQRLEQETAHRKTLVREVHHRIKNNLQGVAGLLHRELGKFAELDPRLQAAISQVDTIAAVHGLQSVESDESIHLCDSVRRICESVSQLTLRSVLFNITNEHSVFTPARISSSEAVPVALVLNELILNAVKHSPADGPPPTVSLEADGIAAQVLIRNAVKEAANFNIDADQGPGTGLRLVRSLLPGQGAQLGHERDPAGFMLTRLVLTAPVVIPAEPMAVLRA